jgi:hypothetical protein
MLATKVVAVYAVDGVPMASVFILELLLGAYSTACSVLTPGSIAVGQLLHFCYKAGPVLSRRSAPSGESPVAVRWQGRWLPDLQETEEEDAAMDRIAFCFLSQGLFRTFTYPCCNFYLLRVSLYCASGD